MHLTRSQLSSDSRNNHQNYIMTAIFATFTLTLHTNASPWICRRCKTREYIVQRSKSRFHGQQNILSPARPPHVNLSTDQRGCWDVAGVMGCNWYHPVQIHVNIKLSRLLIFWNMYIHLSYIHVVIDSRKGEGYFFISTIYDVVLWTRPLPTHHHWWIYKGVGLVYKTREYIEFSNSPAQVISGERWNEFVGFWSIS